MKVIRPLSVIFLLFIELTSCRSSYTALTLRQSDLTPLICNDGQALQYHMSIDLYRKHFSGILIAKQADSAVARLIFVTELGMKIFDFEMRRDSLHLVFGFPGFDSRPQAINLLKADLGLIFLNNIYDKPAVGKKDTVNGRAELKYLQRSGKRTNKYIADGRTKVPLRLIQKGRLRKKIRISYSDYSGSKPGLILIKHTGIIRLSIRMEKLEKS
jgi:hypothetical protein